MSLTSCVGLIIYEEEVNRLLTKDYRRTEGISMKNKLSQDCLDMTAKMNFMIYLHVEKNAGSTMHYILNQNFPFYVTLDSGPRRGNHLLFGDKSLSKLLKITKNKIQGIGGHTICPNFDYGQQVPEDKETFIFTFLRDPIKRWLSHLNFRISAMKQDWSFYDFLENDEFSNFQTKKICGQPDAERAISVLKKFSFIGMMEKFDEGLLLLRDLIDDDININYQRINQSSTNRFSLGDLSNEQISAIHKVNKEDIKLYEYVKTCMYPKQLENYRGNLVQDLEQFQLLNSNYRFSLIDKFWLKTKNQLVKYYFQPISLRNR